MASKKLIIAIVIAILAIVGFLVFGGSKPLPAPEPVPQVNNGTREVIGKSVEGREIESFTFGSGGNKLLLVGGIHGGYEWNSVLLAYEVIDYFKSTPGFIPPSMTVIVIPSINPDGVFKVTGKEGRFLIKDVSTSTTLLASARFNANNVDLNRNFDCKWKPTSTWQNKTVSAGNKAFSEPEAAALRDFVINKKPAAAIFWHSQANTVYASECLKGILPATLSLMDAYAKAAGYLSVKKFDAYEVTGDAEGWLASIGIPAITVELKTHESTEFDKNLAGIKAIFQYYR